MRMFPSLFSLTISAYSPQGAYCEIYPSLEGNTLEFNFNIPYLRMKYCLVMLILTDRSFVVNWLQGIAIVADFFISNHFVCNGQWTYHLKVLHYLGDLYCSCRCDVIYNWLQFSVMKIYLPYYFVTEASFFVYFLHALYLFGLNLGNYYFFMSSKTLTKQFG